MSTEEKMEVEKHPRNTSDSTVHMLPCGMSYDGPTEVNSFFRVQEKADGSLSSTIRGRQLTGEKMELSANGVDVHGLCVTKSGNGLDARLEVTGRFDRMNVWQHDAKPDCNQIREYTDFFEISNSVHS